MVEHDKLLTEVPRGRQIMRDIQHAEIVLFLQIRQQVEHAEAQGHIEHGNRLVGYEQTRP